MLQMRTKEQSEFRPEQIQKMKEAIISKELLWHGLTARILKINEIKESVYGNYYDISAQIALRNEEREDIYPRCHYEVQKSKVWE